VIDYLLIILFVLGPAKALFEQPYYKLMMEALQPGGIIASQGRVQVHNSDQHERMQLLIAGECVWLHLDLIKEMFDFCKEIFPVVDYTMVSVPTYPSGQIGFMLCSLNKVSSCYTQSLQ
jgi:spermidine synthase